MKKIAYVAGFIAFAFLFHSCELDQLLEPTKINLEFTMIGKGEIDDNNKSGEQKTSIPGKLFINKGSVYISEIEFDGTREDAENYYFSKTFDSVLKANLASNQTSEPIEVTIPQGKYSKIEITFHLSNNDSTGYMQLNGSFSNPGLGENNLDILFSGFDQTQDETIELTVQNTEDEKEITLNNYDSRTIEVRFNLNNLFYSFDIQKLNEADLIPVGNQQKIIISDKQNREIYNNILPRLEKSFKAVIK